MIRIWSWLTAGWLSLQPLWLSAQEPVIPDPQWRVARAQFTSAIRNREPIDRIVVATPLIKEVYFFTDLRHLAGRTVTHRWEYEGRVVSLVPFKVGGPRWRVNSMKEIEPDQVGEWSVTVIDESGWPLYTELFRYEIGAPLLLPMDATRGAVPRTDRVEERRSKVPVPPGQGLPAATLPQGAPDQSPAVPAPSNDGSATLE